MNQFSDADIYRLLAFAGYDLMGVLLHGMRYAGSVAGAVRVYHFLCPDCKERKTKLVGVTNAAIEPTFIEICKKGHVMKVERIENR